MPHQDPVTSPLDSAAVIHLADMLDEGVLLTDGDGVVLSANQAARQLFDGEIIGAPIFEVIDDSGFDDLFRKAALEQVELELPYHPKDETIHREFNLRLKRLGDGPVALLFLDMTRQKNLETVRRDFVANVSHELRSP